MTGLIAVAGKAETDRKIIRGTDTFEFTYRVKLPDITSPGRLWMPFARSDEFQSVTVESVRAPVQCQHVRDREHGNRICVLRLGPENSGAEIEVRYRVVREEKPSYRSGDVDAAQFLRPERLVPLNQTFQTIAKEAVGDKESVLERGKALYEHVLSKMRYLKKGDGWGRGDAVYACNVGTGNCTDFHAYFIALARSVGIPARFAIGATIPADRSHGEISGYHCWAEFLADGQWVPVDISEASKNPELADYYFGHHPANRFELTRGRDLVVDPAPRTGPINFLVYPLLEMEGQTQTAETTLSFRRIRL